jgi:hypothetical protein
MRHYDTKKSKNAKNVIICLLRIEIDFTHFDTLTHLLHQKSLNSMVLLKTAEGTVGAPTCLNLIQFSKLYPICQITPNFPNNDQFSKLQSIFKIAINFQNYFQFSTVLRISTKEQLLHFFQINVQFFIVSNLFSFFLNLGISFFFISPP